MSCMLEATRERTPHLEAGALDAWCAGTVRARAAPPSSPGRGGRCGGARAGCRRSLRAWRPPAVCEGWRCPLQPSCARNYSARSSESSDRSRGDGRRPRDGQGVEAPEDAGGRSTPGCRWPAPGPGNRRISVPMASRPSSRASAAPRQWWMPDAERQVLGGAGAGHVERLARRRPSWSASRFADARHGEHEHARPRWSGRRTRGRPS